MVDIQEIPIYLGDALGISTELAGLIIGVAMMVSVAIVLGLVKMNILGVLSVLLSVLILLVALQWMPYWVLLFVCLLIAAMFGRTIAEWFTGGTSRGA